MIKRKRMGRPPAPWMFKLVDLQFNTQWTDSSEVACTLEVKSKTVRSFFEKLSVTPKYEVNKGQARAKFKVSELKKAAKEYITPWQ